MIKTSNLPDFASLTQCYIDGAWRQGRSENYIARNENPFTHELLGEIRGASVEDVDDAFSAAKAAQAEWAATPPRERGQYLQAAANEIDERHNEIVQRLALEAGATHYWATGIVAHAALCAREAARYALGDAGRILPQDDPGMINHVYRKPVGVVAIITPWNSPINLTMRAIAPAMALGNTVVVKPANETPICGGIIHAQIFEKVGLPKGVFNMVIGSSGEISDHFNAHPFADNISFTGSTGVGRKIIETISAASTIKVTGLELGGNAPLIVLDDADLEAAARAIIYGRFLHQGQICMSTNRVLIDAKIHDDMIDLLRPKIEALTTGDPSDPGTAIGPLINSHACKNVLDKIEKAKASGAQMLVGSSHHGNVIPPHLFIDVGPEQAPADDEIFGPVLPIIKFDNDEQAIAIANNTQYGLASAAWSQDRNRAERLAHRIEAGFTNINDITVLQDIYGPFGGVKNSGLGHFNGEWIIDEFTRPHWITYRESPRNYPF